MAALTAQQIARRWMSPRAQRIDRLWRFVRGKQYEGREPFFSRADVPLLERAPNIVYPITASAIRSHGDMLLGEWRWPTPTTASEDDDVGDAGASNDSGDDALSKDDSATLDALIGKIIVQARLKAVARKAVERALGAGTDVTIVSARGGKLCLDTLLAEWCTPTLDPKGGEVQSLEVLYPYIIDSYDSARDKWVQTCWLYRRIVDATTDVVFAPVVAPRDPTKVIVWTPAETVTHGLGFCPVHWYAHDEPTPEMGCVDGVAIHRDLLDEIEGHDFAISQRHRAALYTGDPTQWQTGVDKNESGPQGRAASPHKADAEWRDGNGERLNASPGTVRRRGAGTVLASENENAAFGLLTLPGDALKAQTDNANDLKEKIQESMAVVDIDLAVTKLATDTSGKAVVLLYKRQTDRVGRLREDFGDRWLVPVLHMLLRVAYVVNKRAPGSLYLQGLKAAMAILARFERAVITVDTAASNALALDEAKAPAPLVWMPCEIDLLWGPFFRNSALDQQQVLTLVTTAYQAKLITRRMALEKLKAEGVFEIGQPEALIAAIDAESKERAKSDPEKAPPQSPTAVPVPPKDDGDGSGGDDA